MADPIRVVMTATRAATGTATVAAAAAAAMVAAAMGTATAAAVEEVMAITVAEEIRMVAEVEARPTMAEVVALPTMMTSSRAAVAGVGKVAVTMAVEVRAEVGVAVTAAGARRVRIL